MNLLIEFKKSNLCLKYIFFDKEELYCSKMNKQPLEDLVLGDNRQWTSVKDKHVEALIIAQDSPIAYR